MYSPSDEEGEARLYRRDAEAEERERTLRHRVIDRFLLSLDRSDGVRRLIPARLQMFYRIGRWRER